MYKIIVLPEVFTEVLHQKFHAETLLLHQKLQQNIFLRLGKRDKYFNMYATKYIDVF